MKRWGAVAAACGLFGAALVGMTAVPVDTALAAKSEKAKSGLSFNERRKKCSAEWKDAKAAGQTANQKWPKFWSACNKRLKAGA